VEIVLPLAYNVPLNEANMKNQFRSLQYILVLLIAVIGVNAFTRTQQYIIEQEITEGKIQAAMADSAAPMVGYDLVKRQALVIQQEYAMMDAQFESLATQLEIDGESLPQLSLLAQSLYMYDQQVKGVKFETLNAAQRKALVDSLVAIKKDFYKTLASIRK
jgi:hypothetical protein